MRNLFGSSPAKLKPGPIPVEEIERLSIKAFQQVVLKGKYANAIPGHQEKIDISNDIMSEFMKICEYEMKPKDLVKAKKACQRWVPLVLANKFI